MSHLPAPTQPPPIPRPLRVALVEDIDELREALAELIDSSEGFMCCHSWATMEDALAGIDAAAAHMVLVDLGLPGMDGIEGIRRLKASHPDLPAVALTALQDDERVFRALCAGAAGYLLKKTPAPRLLEGIEDAVTGGSPISPEIARQVIALFTRFSPPPQSDCSLTPHQLRVLKLLVDGYDFESAAALLEVSKATVAFHVRKIYEKLRVHSRSEAVAKALRDGLVR